MQACNRPKEQTGRVGRFDGLKAGTSGHQIHRPRLPHRQFRCAVTEDCHRVPETLRLVAFPILFPHKERPILPPGVELAGVGTPLLESIPFAGVVHCTAPPVDCTRPGKSMFDGSGQQGIGYFAILAA